MFILILLLDFYYFYPVIIKGFLLFLFLLLLLDFYYFYSCYHHYYSYCYYLCYCCPYLCFFQLVLSLLSSPRAGSTRARSKAEYSSGEIVNNKQTMEYHQVRGEREERERERGREGEREREREEQQQGCQLCKVRKKSQKQQISKATKALNFLPSSQNVLNFHKHILGSKNFGRCQKALDLVPHARKVQLANPCKSSPLPPDHLLPDGTFKLTSLTNFSFKHVMEHVFRIPHKCHNFKAEFCYARKFKSPVGILTTSSPPTHRPPVSFR